MAWILSLFIFFSIFQLSNLKTENVLLRFSIHPVWLFSQQLLTSASYFYQFCSSVSTNQHTVPCFETDALCWRFWSVATSFLTSSQGEILLIPSYLFTSLYVAIIQASLTWLVFPWGSQDRVQCVSGSYQIPVPVWQARKCLSQFTNMYFPRTSLPWSTSRRPIASRCFPVELPAPTGSCR